ncbi:unnamed protein product, partial [Ixodes persulcatus]
MPPRTPGRRRVAFSRDACSRHVCRHRDLETPLKDLRQLSPDTQTFSLKSFHNVLNEFAPKSTEFSSEGMLARTRLAALHFNENAEREQAITKDGDHKWKVKTPKARKGHHVVCPVKTEITH